jgi:hypothetical protein
MRNIANNTPRDLHISKISNIRYTNNGTASAASMMFHDDEEASRATEVNNIFHGMDPKPLVKTTSIPSK